MSPSASSLPCLPLGSHKEDTAYCNTTAYESSERRASVEDEGEEGMKEEEEEEEEQRPLCSGVLGYPVVRDHALGLRMKDAPDAQAPDDIQNQPYKGDQNTSKLSLKRI